MTSLRTRKFHISRTVGKFLVELTALATFFRMPPFVGTSAVVAHEGRLLLVLDPIRGEPVLPGGHLRWRETLRDGLIREVWEETGYLIEPGRLIDALSGAVWAGEPGVVRVIYEAGIMGGALQSSPEGEAYWHEIDDFAGSEARDAAIIRLWRERTSDQVDST